MNRIVHLLQVSYKLLVDEMIGLYKTNKTLAEREKESIIEFVGNVCNESKEINWSVRKRFPVFHGMLFSRSFKHKTRNIRVWENDFYCFNK